MVNVNNVQTTPGVSTRMFGNYIKSKNGSSITYD